MSYESIDALQKTLAESVFAHTKDRKKASGRALGTLVELITYYCLCSWGFRDRIAIERSIGEYAHSAIGHNVEFSLHPLVDSRELVLHPVSLPVTAKKICKAINASCDKSKDVLSSKGVLRNCAIVSSNDRSFQTANLDSHQESTAIIQLSELLADPFAMFECKRVGVEEGVKKGPQTIEKAKQGAYVARTVSSLQRARASDGRSIGLVEQPDGSMRIDDYESLRRSLITDGSANSLRQFVLTVGIVSNHGNWFTSNSPHKELRVLANSYDWLLFLSDFGLAQFIEKMLLDPDKGLSPARDAFLRSYAKDKKGNCFTKVRIDREADIALKNYFERNMNDIESWFNIITPKSKKLVDLHMELQTLSAKDWKEI